jgi:diguanylate cyclase (GGDEF)-like protein
VRPLTLCFNAFFAILFALLHVWPLALTWLAALAFHLWLAWHAAIPGREIRKVLHWSWILIFVQSLLAVLMLGPNADFQNYLLATLPAGFQSLQRPMMQKLLQAAAIIGFFLACDIWLDTDIGMYPQPAWVLQAFAHINAVGTCAMLAGMAHAQALTVQEAQEGLSRAATTDVLTGLLNRRAISSFAATEAARCVRKNEKLAFVICDVDHFKRVNDTWGHAAGDKVLKRVAAVLKSMLRGYDGIARWGGEEFLIVLPEASPAEAAVIADRIRQTVLGSRIEFEDQLIEVSMTFGVTGLEGDEAWQASVARADEALYRGKQGGRNRVELA